MRADEQKPDTRAAKNLQAAAKTIGFQLEVFHASTAQDPSLPLHPPYRHMLLDLRRAFSTIQERRLDALIIGDDPFFLNQGDQLSALAERHRGRKGARSHSLPHRPTSQLQ